MVNNEIYKTFGEKWFTAEGDCIALLRIENQTKLPWVLEQIKTHCSNPTPRILDVGCGGGFLTLELAKLGYACVGLDVSEEVTAPGRARDTKRQIEWVSAQAERLPFDRGSFDVVCVMDVLEHVEDPRQVVEEAVRVLKPNGVLLLHTFNKTFLAWLFAERGVEWFIKDTPSHLHEWRYFIAPKSVQSWLKPLNFSTKVLRGIGPKIFSWAFLKLLIFRRVENDFSFQLTSSLQVGYLLCAKGDNLS